MDSNEQELRAKLDSMSYEDLVASGLTVRAHMTRKDGGSRYDDAEKLIAALEKEGYKNRANITTGAVSCQINIKEVRRVAKKYGIECSVGPYPLKVAYPYR